LRSNISIRTEISGVNEFEEILCLDPSLTLESGWVSMADQAAEPSLQSLEPGNRPEK
jgi:hypothetical protein